MCIHVWAVFAHAYVSMGSCACVSIDSCVHNFLRVSPLPPRQLSPSVTTTASGGQDSKGCGCSRRAACLRPPRVKSGNGPGGRAKRQEEQGGMFKADLTLKAPGLTSKLHMVLTFSSLPNTLGINCSVDQCPDPDWLQGGAQESQTQSALQKAGKTKLPLEPLPSKQVGTCNLNLTC